MKFIKILFVLLNSISCLMILISYDDYEILFLYPFKFIAVYCIYGVLLFFLLTGLLYTILGSLKFLKYIGFSINLIVNFYLGRIFLKAQYYQSIYKDFVYETFFFKIKRHYDINEYYNAFAYYMKQKYGSTFIITGDVKETIIRKSRSMSELFRNIDVYILQQQQKPVIVEESVWEKITSVCVSYPVTITLAVLVTCIGVGIVYAYYTGYLNVAAIKGGSENLFSNENLQQDVVNMKETLSEVQKQVTEHSSELDKIVQIQKQVTEHSLNIDALLKSTYRTNIAINKLTTRIDVVRELSGSATVLEDRVKLLEEILKVH